MAVIDDPTVHEVLDVLETKEAISFDGLSITTNSDGYSVETPEFNDHDVDRNSLRRVLTSISPYVTNWQFWQQTIGGDGTARRAFLRWCERAPFESAVQSTDIGESRLRNESEDTGPDSTEPPTLTVPDRYDALADGIVRTWGELRIEATIAETGDTSGTRRYELRHVDCPTHSREVDEYSDPRAARDIATFDQRGRYRPLKTAPTLDTDWIFPTLTGDELVETVRNFYPATIANWHLELCGNLDVDHWNETANRQTGMYDIVDELPRRALDWVAKSCCVDDACLKRREWHADSDDELSVPGGNGEFPCREPCSLVIAAARTWTILESETEHTWTFELTRSEKNQLERLIDAVADGEIDEIREADLNDGANSYRARYLRAKRLDDDGNLCGVETPSSER